MHHSDFIFISVIVLALCGNAVSADAGNGSFPVIIQKVPELPTPQNGTIEIQTPPKDEPETKLLEKDGDSSPKGSYIIKPTPTETNTDPSPSDLQDTSMNPFPKRKMSDASKKDEIDALNKTKLKLKLTKTKAELKEKAEAAKKNSFPKNLEKIDEGIANNSNKTKKYMLLARNSKELKDNMKREQLLEWLYNARPLLENETRLWANMRSEKNNESNKDPEEKAESQTEKDSKSDKNHDIEAYFQTIEAESKEKQRPATKKRTDKTKRAYVALVSEKSTTTTSIIATNDSEESDSSTGNGHLQSKKIIKKAKRPAKMEPETDTTSEETIENVTEKNKASGKRKEKVRTIQRFAPMKDGPSSSESTSVS